MTVGRSEHTKTFVVDWVRNLRRPVGCVPSVTLTEKTLYIKPPARCSGLYIKPPARCSGPYKIEFATCGPNTEKTLTISLVINIIKFLNKLFYLPSIDQCSLRGEKKVEQRTIP